MPSRALLRCTRYVVAAAFLAGCGARSTLGPPLAAAPEARKATGNQTFAYTGREQLFIVPVGVYELTIVARGAAGRDAGSSCRGIGRGARVYAVFPVTPGQKLHVFVGGTTLRRQGGFNGGGDGGTGYGGIALPGAGGGGASDVRRSPGRLSDRLIVAGGGGGAGGHYPYSPYKRYSCGGAGGEVGEAGHSGHNTRGNHPPHAAGRGGGGATQTGGGAGGKGGVAFGVVVGSPGSSGALRSAGDGGDSIPGPSNTGDAGGGGGGGYYGGGGGGAGVVGAPGGGGGGGSSFVERRATMAQFWTGWKDAGGNGQVVFSW